MGRSAALACTCAFLLVFVCATSGTMPDADLSQKEVDLMDLLTSDEARLMMQVEVTESPEFIQTLLKFRGEGYRPAEVPQLDITRTLDADVMPAGRPVLQPRSFGGPKILFPPGQPTPANLQAICLNGSRRPRYPPSALPRSGFGHLHRQADAINRVESWYAACCQANGTLTLCCARQAWEHALHMFCTDEFSIKTRHYHCCKKKDAPTQLRCFQSEAPNPTYLPTNQESESLTAPLSGFTFNSDTCPRRSALRPRGVREKRKRKPHSAAADRDADIIFPPGRPTADNVESICSFRKLRPLYITKCLPRAGYGWLARQSKAINRLERGFKHCCQGQGEVLTCADGKWSEVMDKFCEEEGKSPRFSCCELAPGEERYECFSARAPHPGYGRELLPTPTAPEEPNLGQICGTIKATKLNRKFNNRFPLKKVTSQCCPLPGDQKTACVQEKLVKVSEDLCSGPKVVHRCCSSSSQDSTSCFSSLLMDVITKKSRRLRKCPLS